MLAHESPTIVDAKIWVQTLTPARSFQMQNDKMGDTVVLVSGYSEHGVQRAWFLVSVISTRGRRKQGDHREFEASSRVRLSQNDNCRDCLAGKGTCHQSYDKEFDPGDLYGRKRTNSSKLSFDLASICT